MSAPMTSNEAIPLLREMLSERERYLRIAQRLGQDRLSERAIYEKEIAALRWALDHVADPVQAAE